MPKKKLDPLERSIERAMLPDQFISYQYGSEFVGGLERVKSQIDALVASGEPERAANLYESLIAGCYEKAEEIDDSDGYLGDFAESVFCAWITGASTVFCMDLSGRHPGNRQLLRFPSWRRLAVAGFNAEERHLSQTNEMGICPHLAQAIHDTPPGGVSP